MESVAREERIRATPRVLSGILIDVRSPAEFADGALTGAINVPYESVAQYAEERSDIAKNTDIVLYCRSGRRSAIAANVLRELGFQQVRDLGGLEDARTALEREASKSALR